MQGVFCKIMVQRGISDLFEFNLFRNMTIFLVSVLVLWKQQRDPYKESVVFLDQPTREKLIIRSVLNFCSGFLVSSALSMISFSQIMVLLQTQAFWTSVLGYKINGEPI